MLRIRPRNQVLQCRESQSWIRRFLILPQLSCLRIGSLNGAMFPFATALPTRSNPLLNFCANYSYASVMFVLNILDRWRIKF